MKLLLDTHALLWWLADDARLGPAARRHIGDAGNRVLVSHVSLWETAIKIGIGKLRLDIGAALAAIRERGLEELGLEPAHLTTLAALERHHRDPFDHMLIAQAIVEGATLMSEDARMGEYPVAVLRCG
ncbi:MAG: type II toxin-antitoxin system VapC family toxin [Allosphingosinicella sp.]|uniref:type II toxin-antitoxin system VapC family toxin n=1 Tax=Allosphingosinicella sp. TaxID=2823234 RepID=UPI00395808F2